MIVGARLPSLELIGRRADEHTEYGFELAEKGAVHSARKKFVEALSMIAYALDAHGPAVHRRALLAGLGAVEEAEDFAPSRFVLERETDFSRLIAVHKTPVLKQSVPDRLTPFTALQMYYDYAQQQLTSAAGGRPAASRALYGLARIQPYLAERDGSRNSVAGPAAMALHHAALAVDPRNHQAANELGVLLARYGQLDDAKSAFMYSLSVQPEPETWHNLSRVCEERGEFLEARRARKKQDEQIAASRGPGRGANSRPAIRWVDPAEFSPAAVSAKAAGFVSHAGTPRKRKWAAASRSHHEKPGAAPRRGRMRIGTLLPWSRSQ